MASDGTIRIDVELDDKQARDGIEGINRDARSIDDTQASKLSSTIGTIGKTAAIAVAGLAGISAGAFALGRPLVEAAGAAAALNSQFSEVFGTLESQANVALQGIANETNILENRLKGSFTQIAAFARTTGNDQATSLDIATRATLAAADSAAFYDRSIEDVTESLQSYLKGNFENDAALGISSTETTRNAVANQLYGKSFKDLSEAQKQLTLLRQVEEGNRLSGALGQAAREGEGLENVTGNLRQAFTDLQARLGERILEPVIQGIVLLTDVINRFDIDNFVNGIRNGFARLNESTSGAFGDVINAVQEFVQQVRDYFSLIGDNIVSEFQNILPAIQDFFGTVIATFRSNLQFIVDFWQENGDAILRATVQSLNAVIDFVAGILGRILDFWNENGAQITQAVQNIWTLVLGIIQFALPPIVAAIRIAWDNIKLIISTALDVILGVIRIFIGIFTLDFTQVWEGIKQIFGAAIDFIVTLYQNSFISKIVDSTISFLGSVVEFIQGVWDGIVNAFQVGIEATVGFVIAFGETIFTTVRRSIGYILLAVITFFETIIVGVLEFIESVINYYKDLQERGGNIFANILSDIVGIFTRIYDRVVEIVTNLVESVVNFFTNLRDGAVNTVTETRDTVTSTANTLKDNFVNAIRNLYEGAIQLFRNLRDGIVSIFTELIPNLITQIRNLVSNLISELRTLARDGVNAVKDFARDTFDTVKSLPSQFLQVGKDVVTGFIDGIKSINPINAVKGVFEGVKDTVRNIFDINSPSKWARDEIVGSIAEGFDAGAVKYRSEFEFAGATIAGDVQNPFVGTSPLFDLNSTSLNYPQNQNTSSGQSNTIINNFNQAESTPYESARKQEEMLRRLALEF